MEPNKILSARLIDLIFDGRNQSYGAYYLRDTYPRRIKKAILFTTAIAAMAFGGVALANVNKKKKSRDKFKEDIILTEYNVKPVEPPKEIPKPIEQPPAAEPTRTVAFTPPTIVDDPDVDKPMAAIANLDSAQISDVTKGGNPDIDVPNPPESPVIGGGDPKGIIQPKAQPEETRTTVDVAAKFEGNWKRFLENNLNAEVPVENGAPAGRYSVVVQFVVDKDGSVSDIKPLTNHGYGVEQEAVRVLKKAPKWSPAIFQGFIVKAYHRQIIVFEVTE